jgi:hypothetical protein
MRLAQKFSLSFASLAFIMVLFPALLKRQDPSKVIFIAIAASFISGFVGYVMGNIFTHPKILLKRSSAPSPSTIDTQSPPPLALPSPPAGKTVSPRVIRSRAAAALAGTSSKSTPTSEPEEASAPSEEASAPSEEASAPLAEASPEPSSETSATSTVETPSNDPLP